jgi:hypothetical protein
MNQDCKHVIVEIPDTPEIHKFIKDRLEPALSVLGESMGRGITVNSAFGHMTVTMHSKSMYDKMMDELEHLKD